jgi:hypothetical protein
MLAPVRAMPFWNGKTERDVLCAIINAGPKGCVMAGPSEESPGERLVRYRNLAAEALALAEKCESDDLRQAYRALANGWMALADDLAKASRLSGKS